MPVPHVNFPTVLRIIPFSEINRTHMFESDFVPLLIFDSIQVDPIIAGHRPDPRRN